MGKRNYDAIKTDLSAIVMEANGHRDLVHNWTNALELLVRTQRYDLAILLLGEIRRTLQRWRRHLAVPDSD